MDRITFAVLGVTIFLFVTEKLRMDIVALNHILNSWRRRAHMKTTFVGCLAVYLCGTIASAAELQKAGEFQGNWTAVGTAQTLALGELRSASILRLRGTIVTQSSHGLAPALQSDCVGLNLKEERGRFLDGTGKYAGIEGGYELDWQYLQPIQEEGTIHGYSTSMTGRWTLP